MVRVSLLQNLNKIKTENQQQDVARLKAMFITWSLDCRNTCSALSRQASFWLDINRALTFQKKKMLFITHASKFSDVFFSFRSNVLFSISKIAPKNQKVTKLLTACGFFLNAWKMSKKDLDGLGEIYIQRRVIIVGKYQMG